MSTEARVDLWGRQIGAVVWDEQRELGVFQYTPEFAESGITLSPVVMPPSKMPYSFPALRGMFHGLPGLVADSLPDKFGHRLIASLPEEGSAILTDRAMAKAPAETVAL